MEAADKCIALINIMLSCNFIQRCMQDLRKQVKHQCEMLVHAAMPAAELHCFSAAKMYHSTRTCRFPQKSNTLMHNLSGNIKDSSPMYRCENHHKVVDAMPHLQHFPATTLSPMTLLTQAYNCFACCQSLLLCMSTAAGWHDPYSCITN